MRSRRGLDVHAVARAFPGLDRSTLLHVRRRAGRSSQRECPCDLVLRCGESTAGPYCAALLAVATTWTELQAIWGLHQQHVTCGIEAVHQRLPFPLREWHRDDGSEFINARLLGWC